MCTTVKAPVNRPQPSVGRNLSHRPWALVTSTWGTWVLSPGVALAAPGDSPWASPGSHSDAGSWISCPLGGAPLTGNDLLWLVGIAVALVLMAFAAYRGLLEGEVRRGTEPRVLSSSIVALSAGAWLLAAFALIPNVLGLCWFGVVGALLVLVLVVLMITGRLMVGLGVGFLLIAAVVVILLQFVFR